MNILAIDTATEACSVAILKNDGTSDGMFKVCPQQHSQQILPMIDTLLERNQIVLKQLDAIAYGRGPGSFTGVRIAASTVQGLALGCDLPVIEVSTLAAMAQQNYAQYGAHSSLVLIDARMGEVYAAKFEIKDGVATPESQEVVIPPSDIQAIYGESEDASPAGTGYLAYPEALAHTNTDKLRVLYPDATFMLPLAKAMIEASKLSTARDLNPVYVRDKVTWQKLPHKK